MSAKHPTSHNPVSDSVSDTSLTRAPAGSYSVVAEEFSVAMLATLTCHYRAERVKERLKIDEYEKRQLDPELIMETAHLHVQYLRVL